MKTLITVSKDGPDQQHLQWGDLPGGITFGTIYHHGKHDCLIIKSGNRYTVCSMSHHGVQWDGIQAAFLPPLLHVYQSAHIQLK